MGVGSGGEGRGERGGGGEREGGGGAVRRGRRNHLLGHVRQLSSN